jgi:hypothetical protein
MIGILKVFLDMVNVSLNMARSHRYIASSDSDMVLNIHSTYIVQVTLGIVKFYLCILLSR